MKRLRRDERGAAAIMFAVSLVLLVPLIIGVFEVYYGSEQRAKLQDALDAAALFAARSTATTDTDLTTVGRTALDANLTLESGALLKTVTFKINGDVVIADAVMTPASLLAAGSTLWRHPDMSVHAEVNRAMDKLEVALVLDNTGSMQGTKLTTLKDSAKNLVDKLKAASDRSTETDPIKIALVPFSNTVRAVGTTSLSGYTSPTSMGAVPAWIDPLGKSRGATYDNFARADVDRLLLMKNMTRSGTALSWEGCVEARTAPYDVQQDTPSSTTPETMYVPWFWPDEADLTPAFKPSGSSTAYAGSYNDYLNDIPTWVSTRAYGAGDIVAYVPGSATAYNSSSTYAIGAVVSSSSVLYVSLTASNKNKTPASNPTNWAPAYWKSSTTNTNKVPGTATDWVIDTASAFARQKSVAKYGVTATALKNTAWYALDSTAYGANGSYIYGPNGGCALTQVSRLTTNLQSIKDAIDTMTAIGETNIPIGLAWGWNALSPTGPYSDGRSYTAEHNRKIVILMTDGENTMNDPSKTSEPNGSFYGGYGYIWQNMLGMTSGASGVRTTAIDDRLTLLCDNVKKKGIVVYTVRVEVSSGSSSLLQGCASSPDKFYDVQNVSQLGAAFDAIARSIDNLRISK